MAADPMKIALAVDEHTAGVVTVPKIGVACAGCAEGHGFTTRWP